jgi:hypothetical protein
VREEEINLVSFWLIETLEGTNWIDTSEIPSIQQERRWTLLILTYSNSFIFKLLRGTLEVRIRVQLLSQ